MNQETQTKEEAEVPKTEPKCKVIQFINLLSRVAHALKQGQKETIV
jgi:hypothetical protein